MKATWLAIGVCGAIAFNSTGCRDSTESPPAPAAPAPASTGYESSENWYVWWDRMPGAGSNLHVKGDVWVATDCHDAALSELSGPGAAEELHLTVSVTKRDEACAQVRTTRPVRLDIKDFKGGKTHAVIHLPDNTTQRVKIVETH